MGHNVKNLMFGYWGGGGGGVGGGYDCAHLASQLSSHFNNIHVKYGSNPIRIFDVTLRTMKCLRTNDD